MRERATRDGGRSGARSEVIRVAFDVTPLIGEWTGVARFVHGALGALAALDELCVTAYAVTWRRQKEAASKLPRQVRMRGLPMPARPLGHLWRRGSFPPAELFVGPVQVVHGTNFTVPPTWRAVRVVSVHDLTPLSYPELCEPVARSYASQLRHYARSGVWMQTPSQSVATELVEVLGANPARVRAVPYGVPGIAAAIPLATHASAPPEPPARIGKLLPEGTSRYVLAIGTAEPRKNLPSLVRAFDLIAPSHRDVALVIAGGKGWDEGALDEAISSSPFRKRIVRTGYASAEALTGLLRHAALFAFPSIYEGFGFPPLEAMASGVPVVATKAGSLPEVLGDAALLVPVKDDQALAEEIAKVLDDEELAARLARLGLDRARRFTWEQTARGLSELYIEAAACAESSQGGSRRRIASQETIG